MNKVKFLLSHYDEMYNEVMREVKNHFDSNQKEYSSNRLICFFKTRVTSMNIK